MEYKSGTSVLQDRHRSVADRTAIFRTHGITLELIRVEMSFQSV